MPVPDAAALGPSIGLGIGSAVAGLATGMMGASSQREANELNAQYNRELLAFQRYQYEDQKRYNSITEQVRRMRAAGLNPSLLMQNGTIGTSASAVGAPSMIPQQPIDVAGIGSAVSSIAGIAGSSLSDFARAAKDTQEAIGEAINNQTRGESNRWTIDNKKALSYMHGLQGDVNAKMAEFLDKSLGDRLMQQRWESELTRARAGISLTAMSYAEGQQRANISNLWAQAYNAVLTGQASVKQAFAAVKNAITNENNSHALYGLDDEDRADFFEDTLDQLESAADANRSTSFKNTFTPWGYNAGSKLFGSVSHNTVEGHQSEFESFRNTQQFQLSERRKQRREARIARKKAKVK